MQRQHTVFGHALELIQLGKQDVVFAGGGEELHWSSAMMFDAMGAVSTKYNEEPEKALVLMMQTVMVSLSLAAVVWSLSKNLSTPSLVARQNLR